MFGGFLALSFPAERCHKTRAAGPFFHQCTEKLSVEFFATVAPNHLRLTQNSCLVGFWHFHFRRNGAEKLTRGDRFPTDSPKKPVVEFFVTAAPNHLRFTRNLCLVGIWHFHFRRNSAGKLVRHGHFFTNAPKNSQLNFLQRSHPIISV